LISAWKANVSASAIVIAVLAKKETETTRQNKREWREKGDLGFWKKLKQ
jgi:hypothetical protein